MTIIAILYFYGEVVIIMSQTRLLMLNAVVAALYAALTIGLAPVSYGPVQVRLSECMTLLAFGSRRYVPGLISGCFIANFGSPLGVADIFVGTAATALSVYIMSRCRNLCLASLVPVVVNGAVIGLELFGLDIIPAEALVPTALYIGAGELLSVTVLGVILYSVLRRNDVIRQYIEPRK